MTAVAHICSDDRVALARRGALSSAEWQELAGHLAVCAECRITWRLTVDFEQSASPVPGDELVVGRAMNGALARRRDGRSRLFRLALAASVLLMAAGAASAAVMLRGHLLRSHSERGDGARMRPAAAPTGVSRREGPPGDAAAQARAWPVPSLPTTDLAPAEAPLRETERALKKQTAVHLGSLQRISPRTSSHTDEDAASVFGRAVKQREQGRTAEAIATFRSLQHQFPGTPQALVSLVSLADLLLASDDAAAALDAFDGYLGADRSGPLAAEALLGKVRALTALGRLTEADAVSREIARRYPDSPYGRPIHVQRIGDVP